MDINYSFISNVKIIIMALVAVLQQEKHKIL